MKMFGVKGRAILQPHVRTMGNIPMHLVCQNRETLVHISKVMTPSTPLQFKHTVFIRLPLEERMKVCRMGMEPTQLDKLTFSKGDLFVPCTTKDTTYDNDVVLWTIHSSHPFQELQLVLEGKISVAILSDEKKEDSYDVTIIHPPSLLSF